jgi:hypothetical protein
VSDEPRLRMIKPQDPKPREWQVNQHRRAKTRVKPTSGMLMEKYTGQQQKSVFQRLGEIRGRGQQNKGYNLRENDQATSPRHGTGRGWNGRW